MDNKKIAKKLNKIAKELLSVEFPNQKAMNDYLKQHPLAERRNHKVVEFKPEKKQEEIQTEKQNFISELKNNNKSFIDYGDLLSMKFHIDEYYDGATIEDDAYTWVDQYGDYICDVCGDRAGNYNFITSKILIDEDDGELLQASYSFECGSGSGSDEKQDDLESVKDLWLNN